MTTHTVWDPFIRVFHFTFAGFFIANALMIEDSSPLHIWVGYILLGLVLTRLVWGMVGRRFARFSKLPIGSAAIRSQIKDIKDHAPRTHLGHSPLGGLMVINLLLSVIAISITGIALTGATPAGWAEDVHEMLVIWAELSVVAHIAAVIWESRRTHINLPLAMITGRKHVPDTIHIKE